MDIKEKLCRFLDEKGRITAFPVKRKMKLYALVYISEAFEKNRDYTESEVNDIIDRVTTFDDAATIRRELWGNRFIARTKDCKTYRMEDVQPTPQRLGIEL